MGKMEQSVIFSAQSESFLRKGSPYEVPTVSFLTIGTTDIITASPGDVDGDNPIEDIFD